MGSSKTVSKLLSDFFARSKKTSANSTPGREEQITRQSSRGECLTRYSPPRTPSWKPTRENIQRLSVNFLMDQYRQDELDKLVQQIFKQPELSGFRNRSVVPRLKMSLVKPATGSTKPRTGWWSSCGASSFQFLPGKPPRQPGHRGDRTAGAES